MKNRLVAEAILIDFAKTGKLPEDAVDQAHFKDLLLTFGAEEEISEIARKSLGKYTNKGKADGLREVWGERFEQVKRFIEAFIADYEVRTDITLPVLKPSGVKFSGMRAYFGEVTAYAYGAMRWADFKRYSEARWHNGAMWEQGRKDERVRVSVPTSSKPILLSSFPPDFPRALLDFMGKGFLLT